LVSTPTWEIVGPALAAESSTLQSDVRAVLKAQPALEAEELDTAWREALRARRSALNGLRHDGVISQEVFDELASEVDAWLQRPMLSSLDTSSDATASASESAS